MRRVKLSFEPGVTTIAAELQFGAAVRHNLPPPPLAVVRDLSRRANEHAAAVAQPGAPLACVDLTVRKREAPFAVALARAPLADKRRG